MSGFPNMQDIAALRDALAAITKEQDAIERAEKEQAHAAFCIDQATQRLLKAQGEMKRLMEAMDCHAPGNAGYAHRLTLLLTGLAQHAEQHGRIRT